MPKVPKKKQKLPLNERALATQAIVTEYQDATPQEVADAEMQRLEQLRRNVPGEKGQTASVVARERITKPSGEEAFGATEQKQMENMNVPIYVSDRADFPQRTSAHEVWHINEFKTLSDYIDDFNSRPPQVKQQLAEVLRAGVETDFITEMPSETAFGMEGTKAVEIGLETLSKINE